MRVDFFFTYLEVSNLQLGPTLLKARPFPLYTCKINLFFLFAAEECANM